MTRSSWRETLAFIGRSAKRVAVAVVGGAIVLLGVVLMPLPGPGILIVMVGLTILASEFAWALHALDAGKRNVAKATAAAKGVGRRIAGRRAGGN